MNNQRFKKDLLSYFSVKLAQKYLLVSMICWDTCRHIQEIGHINVSYAINHFFTLVFWRNTWEFTLRKRHIHVKHVEKGLVQTLFWKHTKGFTQERNHFHVFFVVQHFHIVLLCPNIRFIQARDHSHVIFVTSCL